MKLYVYAKSKAELNARLEKGEWIWATLIDDAGNESEPVRLTSVRDGMPIAIWDRVNADEKPLGKEYGLWSKGKVQ